MRFSIKNVVKGLYFEIDKAHRTTGKFLNSAGQWQEISYNAAILQHEGAICYLCGIIDEYNVDEDYYHKALVKALNCNDYSIFDNISGDYIAVIFDKGTFTICNSVASQREVFWRQNGERLYISTHLSMFGAESEKTLNVDKLALLCFGEDILIYDHVEVLKRGHILRYDRSITTSKLKIHIPQIDDYSINQLSIDVFDKINRSVNKKTAHFNKVALLLSGGIDSSALAVSLSKTCENLVLYTWSSGYSKNDEAVISREVASRYGLQLRTINLASLPNNYIVPKFINTSFPYTHPVSSWWEIACNLAKEEGCQAIVSGHYGSLFGNTFDFNAMHGVKDKFNALSNSLCNPAVSFPKKTNMY